MFCLFSFIVYKTFRFERTKADKISVVCTTGMIASTVQSIVGNEAEVFCLMGPGVDPHTFKVRPSDVARIQSADLLVFNGLHLEGKMTDLFEQSDIADKSCSIQTFVDPKQLIEVAPGVYDPHVWHDVLLWSSVIDSLTERLLQLMPEKADSLYKNASEYKHRLLQLHQQLLEMYAKIPTAQRILITAHDAFGYFGRAYGFQVVALQGVSTDVQAGLADLLGLATFIVDHKVPVIFLESCIPSKSMVAVAEKVEALGFKVMLGNQLLADAVGMQGADQVAYQQMMLDNMHTIMNGFGYSALPEPFERK